MFKILIMKNLKKIGRALSKMEQKEINGGFGGCDIAPPGCPCIVPPNHPCLDGGSSGGGSTGVCFGFPGTFPCDSTCPDGSAPICG